MYDDTWVGKRPTSYVGWVRLAEQRIRNVLDDQHAVVRREVEARLAEHYFQTTSDRFNVLPHVTTTALQIMQRSGEIVTEEGATRGGSVIRTLQYADTQGRATDIARAAARKRLLYARFRGWSQPNGRYKHGQIGPAGEAAARAALIRSQQISPFMADAAELTQLRGYTFQGPVDTGGWAVCSAPDPSDPPEAVAVLVEVKNLRAWLYASDVDVWQLLRKAQALQEHSPKLNILPVLVCRRAHDQVRWMGSQLGFLVVETKANFVGAVPEADAMEVRRELQFTDVKVGTEPNPSMIKAFRATIPANGRKYAAIWRESCTNSASAEPIRILGARQSAPEEREQAMGDLMEASMANGYSGWRLN